LRGCWDESDHMELTCCTSPLNPPEGDFDKRFVVQQQPPKPPGGGLQERITMNLNLLKEIKVLLLGGSWKNR
jgi:hypothetical protein